MAFVDTQNFFQTQNKFDNISDAIVEVITKFWSKNQFSVNFVTATSREENYDYGDVISLISQKSCMTQKISSYEVDNIRPGIPKRCTVFFIECFEDFLKVLSSLIPNHYLFRGFYLIILTNGEILELHEIFKHVWKLQIYNVNVMFEGPFGDVIVKTFMPFNDGDCNDTTPVLINKFANGKFVNDVMNFFPDKMEDLHNCPMRVATSNNAEPYIFAEILPAGNYSLKGRDISLVETLSQSLNFKLEIVFVGDEGFLHEDGSAKGPFELLLKKQADLIVADYWLKPNRLKFIDNTTPYISQQIAFVIPPGMELSSFEKFVRPLDTTTWIFYLGFIGVALFVIYAVKRTSTSTQNFVFGEGVNNPILNLVIAIMGGNQHVEPRKNFARYLLMMFLIFCLVMRTLYQGSMFRFIKSKVYHREVQSLDEMLKNDFKFYTVPSIIDLLQGQSRIYQRLMSLV